MNTAAVVSAADVPAGYTTTGACVRTLLAAGAGRPQLVRRLVDVPPRSRFEGTAGADGELWFVISGTGRLDIDAHPAVRVQPDRGLWIPPGAGFRLHADGQAGLRIDAVTLPAPTPEDSAARAAAAPAAGQPPASTPLARDLAECAVETTGDRRFRVLFGPGQDCAVATQFVGEIPPGRAPDHSHPYDEVVLVLEGAGVVHLDGTERALSPGTCTHLPPGVVHCLENTGSATMRVLGVFHPADSPAAKLAGHG